MKTTVVGAISILGLVAIVEAISGLSSIGGIIDNFDYMSSNALPTISEVGDIKQATLSTELALAVVALTPPEGKAAANDKYKQAMDGADALLTDYKRLLVDDGDRQTYGAVTDAWTDWKKNAAIINQAGASNDQATVNKTLPLLNADADKLVAAIKAMADDKRQNADDEATQAKAAASSGRTIATVALGLLVLVLIGTIGLVLGRVLNPLGRITAAMGRIANNELDLEVPGASRRDEIGAMAGAVEVFRQNGIRIRSLSEEERAQASAAAAIAAEGDAMGVKLTEAVVAASHGDFTMRVPTTYSQDNLNQIAGIVNNLMDTVERGLGETGEVLSAVANTDLTRRVEGDYEGSFLRLKTDTNAVAEKLTEIVGQLKHTSGSLKLATGEILSGANDLSERTTKQAATIEETSAAMEQLAQTVQNNSKRASEASVVAGTVTRTAEEGGQVMGAANEAMERITQSSAKISNIIGLIDDIAFQTNLLALNASVEAARAGEAGKGFAVVAVEVRRLAQSAAEASSEVKALIEQSGVEVSGGSKLVADAAQKLTAMVAAARSSSELMDGIAKDSQSQASAIEEVSTAVRQMDEMTQHNAALVEEINAAIEQTESQANDLDRIVDVFTIEGGAQMLDSAADSRPARTPATRPAAKATGIKAMQEKVKRAAKSYLSRGNAAVKEDWSEF